MLEFVSTPNLCKSSTSSKMINFIIDSSQKSGYILARMRHSITLAPEAVDDFEKLSARDRSTVRDAIEIHLRYEPEKVSKSRIKRLRGMSRPQYRIRVGEFRIFYDVVGNNVEILSIIPKSKASEWLERYGEKE